jgi:hypothetical protein
MSVVFELNQDSLRYLEELKIRCGASTRAEVLRNAMAIMSWAVDKTRAGYQILAVAENEETAKELSNPLLDRAAEMQRSESEASLSPLRS